MTLKKTASRQVNPRRQCPKQFDRRAIAPAGERLSACSPVYCMNQP
jgi:hypothetical protein